MLSTRKQETRKKGNLIKYEGGQVVKTTELLRAVGLVFTSVYLIMLTVLIIGFMAAAHESPTIVHHISIWSTLFVGFGWSAYVWVKGFRLAKRRGNSSKKEKLNEQLKA